MGTVCRGPGLERRDRPPPGRNSTKTTQPLLRHTHTHTAPSDTFNGAHNLEMRELKTSAGSWEIGSLWSQRSATKPCASLMHKVR